MKHYYLILAALLLAPFSMNAQVNLTIQVDMNEQTVSDSGVHVAGSFQGWDPASTELTDVDADGIYEVTLQVDPDSTYEYKFINGNDWPDSESVPGQCAQNNNRFVAVGATDLTTDLVCYASCDTCGLVVPTTNVTFRVRMGGGITVADTVSVAGSFQGVAGFNDWSPGETVLTDVDADGVYEVTVTVPQGQYGYKFINGTAWGQDEGVPCSCKIGGNRGVDLTSAPADTTLDIVCFGSCSDNCPSDDLVDVTFRVDMSNEFLAPEGVFVAGSFSAPAWDKDTFQLMDGDGDGIYEATLAISAKEHEFKFYNGIDSTGGDGVAEDATNGAALEKCGCDNGIGGFNRNISAGGQGSAYLTPVYVFGTCDELSGGVDIETELEGGFNIYPNPFNHTAIIEFKNDFAASYDVIVTDLTGKTVRVINDITDSKVTLEKGNLTNGLYFVSLRNAAGETFTQKVIIR
ncbi:T9SS type A sorting domain-containing protein [Pontibacter sp. G13]|uniref:pullulanase X25 domain-containing protein n=1 Tax=Pontibacter sp. G13 TaxID=3074898 RepID=UPI00288BDAF6|nr:T9SS type A sorting domain-containing protein [Pontibacter sp. G13]WNJ19730.1 T9SS type A sorting domain-containing protein [Pontibacter sp. G13]